jgi:hypothetical protein
MVYSALGFLHCLLGFLLHVVVWSLAFRSLLRAGLEVWAQVVEPNKHKALNSTLSTAKKSKNERAF